MRKQPSQQSEITITLPELHSSQQRILDESAGGRYFAVVCGRRWGKTTFCQELATQPILDGKPVGYFAPDYKRLDEYWAAMKHVLAPITTRRNEQRYKLDTMTGGSLECWTLQDDDAGRSRKYARVIIDEAGLADKLERLWTDAIRPTLLDMRGDAWFLGTPKGRNYFHTVYRRTQDPHYPAWRGWQMPTAANPYILPSEIEEMRRDVPERAFYQEVLAQFLEDGGAVFRSLDTACTLKPLTGPEEGGWYVMGVDWGRHDDYTVFSVIDAMPRPARQVYIERMGHISYPEQAARLKALIDIWKPYSVRAESNAMGEPIIEGLQAEGINITAHSTNAATKNPCIEALALGLETGSLMLLDDETQKNELMAYTVERMAGGTYRYGAPEGMHDDTVMSTALAYLDARTDYDQWLVRPEPVLSDDEQFERQLAKHKPHTGRQPVVRVMRREG